MPPSTTVSRSRTLTTYLTGIASRAPDFLIGRMLGLAALGIYGRALGLVSLVWDNIYLSLCRVLAFFRQGMGDRLKDGAKARLRTLDRDVASLTEYDAQLSAEIGFLLQAAFGLIGLEQNAIIKVFSIAAVLFLPPTLVGTVYGMNFERMPELHWLFGYPFALALMVASAVAPYLWFKRRGWL